MSLNSQVVGPTFEFIVIGHDVSSNALGRAISLAMVSRELGITRLLAFGRGRTWAGSRQFDIEVERLSRNWKHELRGTFSQDEEVQTVVWLSKGLAPLDRLARYVRQAFPGAIVILDLDDDDAALAEAFAKRSVSNRLKLNPLRRGHASQIRKAQSKIAALAHGFTFSSNSLASVFPSKFIPRTRIPHVRTDISGDSIRPTDGPWGIRFGSLGTLRPHKGSALLLELMRSNKDLTLVSFKDCGLGRPGPGEENWIEIPSDTPLHEAYAQIDVSVIPITDGGAGAQFQLPAKLVDSMRSGVPVLASPTPAIEEIASGTYARLEPDATLMEISGLVRQLSQSNYGALGRMRYEEFLTPAAAAQELLSLLKPVKVPKSPQ
ncbi:glycosyltransferase [Arthrobacter sp. ISL-30]|uniref:glycosyltransferase n=1 Tax=Arthrobacter sp. ISL-30 TaxID=2819109 RepID=UPI001BE74275|nr:glycosyltransferase [Arthrobacter sp. ISL-30]MBT2515741.1 glycosyltransferase [Arthrobacter sp. ISL-30]